MADVLENVTVDLFFIFDHRKPCRHCTTNRPWSIIFFSLVTKNLWFQIESTPFFVEHSNFFVQIFELIQFETTNSKFVVPKWQEAAGGWSEGNKFKAKKSQYLNCRFFLVCFFVDFELLFVCFCLFVFFNMHIDEIHTDLTMVVCYHNHWIHTQKNTTNPMCHPRRVQMVLPRTVCAALSGCGFEATSPGWGPRVEPFSRG